MLSLYIRAYWVDKANHRRFPDAAVGQLIHTVRLSLRKITKYGKSK
jgi:hypothetical protein